MIDLLNWTAGLFNGCTQLYPRRFRQEYGEELQGVFRERMLDAMNDKDLLNLVKFMLREFRDLPVNIIKQQWGALMKKLGLDPNHKAFSQWRVAWIGGLAFGVGEALLLLFRWASDPANNLYQRNISLALLRETLSFGLVNGIGWLLISNLLFPAPMAKRLAWKGLFFGALGCFLGNLFLTFVSRLLGTISDPIGYAVHFIAYLILGACCGAPLAAETGFETRRLRWVLLISACFGLGFLAFYGAFGLFTSIPLVFRLQLWYWISNIVHSTAAAGLFWVFNAVGSDAVAGCVEGALLGWLVWRERPRLLDPKQPLESSDPLPSNPERRQFLVQPSGLDWIKSNYLTLHRYP